MKLIVVGCEYAGKSTLIQEIVKWQRQMYIHVNVHDHFTYPGAPGWDQGDQEKLLSMTPDGISRIQRFGHIYHTGNQPSWGMLYGDVIYEGFYIEDHVYGEMYYGYRKSKDDDSPVGLGDAEEFAAELAVKPGMKHVPNLHGYGGQHFYESMIKEADPETILLLVEARPEVIARRMTEAPHSPQRIEKKDIATLLKMFRADFKESMLVNRMVLDTSDATIEETFEQFKRDVTHFLTEKDLLRMILYGLRTGKTP